MGEVWLAEREGHGGLCKTVALKQMHAGLLADPRHARLFVEEVRIGMRLHHANIVHVFDVGVGGDGRPFMAMEWVDGVDLARLLTVLRHRRERVAPEVAAYVTGELLRALEYAHTLTHAGEDSRIVHRDVSPHNVLVSVSGEVKLADFGVARLARAATSGMFLKGKLQYMAPEYARGGAWGPSIDLFGAGTVLHELLTGQRYGERDGEGPGEGIRPGDPVAVWPGVPPLLLQLRHALLQRDPTRRIPTPTRALAALRRWSGYRVEAAALAAVCREFVGVSAPRSGLPSAYALEVPTGQVDGGWTQTRTALPVAREVDAPAVLRGRAARGPGGHGAV